MHTLLDVFCGRNPRTKFITVLRACSATSSCLPSLVVLPATAFVPFFIGVAIGADFKAEEAVEDVYVVEEDKDGSADVRRERGV